MTDVKTAWVTGAGTGIGQAGALDLARRGYTVIVSGRRREPLEDTASQIEAAGGTCIIEPLDVADSDACAAVAGRINDRFGRLDVLVANAGLNVKDRHTDVLTVADWRKVIDVDVNGVFHCIHPMLPIMRAQGGGLIINVSSWAGRWPAYLAGAAYNAAKHAVSAMNELINMEEGENGIRCTALCPGEVYTPIMEARPVPPSLEEKKKMVQMADMGDVIGYLAGLPPHVCINELVISPTHNRIYAAGKVR
ncbi:SDR family oxidoreductase [Minwuia sp.]|uniref:SDR family oxidoreductase n=1 Tax=Minwuia sp. TaxID=2493630 RepID=UPI003A92CDE4